MLHRVGNFDDNFKMKTISLDAAYKTEKERESLYLQVDYIGVVNIFFYEIFLHIISNTNPQSAW